VEFNEFKEWWKKQKPPGAFSMLDNSVAERKLSPQARTAPTRPPEAPAVIA
jgi:hypothetical protein